MKWEIRRKEQPNIGDIRFRTRFAWLPTQVLNNITMTDHMVWLELYLEEQEYVQEYHGGEGMFSHWKTVAKTIHI